VVPLIALVAATVFYTAKRHYLDDVQRVGGHAPATGEGTELGHAERVTEART
jgi:hypothetical protein